MTFAAPLKKRLLDAGPLDADAWVEAALDVLADSGVEAVRIEPLAKVLGVTKGSFYWHFKDRPALLAAMLATWRARATLSIIDRLERDVVRPQDRLRELIALPRKGSRAARGADIEAAMRFWGRTDPSAASAVREIDLQRIDYIKSLVVATRRHPHREAALATLVYAFILAEASIGPALDPAARMQCEEILLRIA
jgi:AcrR family transcriptional regulator